MGSRHRKSSNSSDERGRSMEKRSEGLGLSSFYRERFGSHSPEEYMNLRISGFDEKLERDEIKELLSKEFRDFRPFEIKVVRQPGDDERLAYVNFERRDCARKIRYGYIERLRRSLGKRILCDPAGILRDQEGKYIPDRFNRQLQGIDRDQQKRGRSPERGRNAPKQPNVWRLKENDTDATRTLFVGNMPQDIKEHEIRRSFERYGTIEDIDIKTPANTDAAYAFIMYQTMEQAVDAKHSLHDRAVRSGGPRCKIGYGKSQVSRRLWVGGLGSWTSAEMLAQEFDRYGLIEKLDYEDGAEFGYIRFADVNAAQDAFKGMKGFPLGGKGRCICVDFAKDDTASKDPLHHIGGTHLGHARKRKADSPGGPRTPPGSPKPIINTFEQLDEEFATTWQGQVCLKKSEYNTRMYRIGGAEKVLQKKLRDEDGNARRLRIEQRLALSNQESVFEKLIANPKEMAVMIAVGKQINEFAALIKYLNEKNAAGVVQESNYILYLFHASDTSRRLLAKVAPHIRLLDGDSPFLLALLTTPQPS